MVTKTVHASEQKELNLERATALHLATIQHDHAGESVNSILHNVKEMVPETTEHEVRNLLHKFAEKKFLKVKPDDFVRVFPEGSKHLASIASQAM